MKTVKFLSVHPAIIDVERVREMTLNFDQPFVKQVQDHFHKMGDLRGWNVAGLPGQAVAAVTFLPILEMTTGLPSIQPFQPGVGVVGDLVDLGYYRNKVVRPRRSEIPEGEAYSGYTVLDGSGRGLTDLQLSQVQKEIGSQEVRVMNVSMGQVDITDLTNGVANRLLETGLTNADWTSGRVLFLPGGLGLAAAVMATAIHGLSEAWPKTIRLNKVGNDFVVQEIVDVFALRQWGVQLLASWKEGTAPVPVPRNLLEEVANFLDARTEFFPNLEAYSKFRDEIREYL